MFLINLDRLIESQGISKNEFSKKIGIAPSTISSWYNKGYENISLKTLIKLSNYFNVSLDELIFGKSKNKELNDCYNEDMYAINEIRKLLNNYKKRLKYRFSPDEDTKIYLVKCKKCNKTIMVYAYEPLSHIEKCPKCIKLQQEEMALE
jgi:transcriptional regulator with XRE-family HTH domain